VIPFSAAIMARDMTAMAGLLQQALARLADG
jgi:hypothetical protein